MATTRSRSQIIFKHLPGSVFYEEETGCLGRVGSVQGNVDTSIDPNRLADRIRTELDRWRAPAEGGIGQVTPDIKYVTPSDLEVIRPEYVEWEMFPYYFRCRRSACGVWQYKRDLFERRGRCVRCDAPSVEQAPFVWIHHCGYLVPLAPGRRQQCPSHKERALYLYDTGTFTTSSWR